MLRERGNFDGLQSDSESIWSIPPAISPAIPMPSPCSEFEAGIQPKYEVPYVIKISRMLTKTAVVRVECLLTLGALEG